MTGSRLFLSGAIAMGAVLFGLLAGGARFVPLDSLFGPLARMIDPFAPLTIALGLALAGLVWALGPRRVGVVLCLAILANGAGLVRDHLRLSTPLAPGPPTLRVLFFNLQKDNAHPAPDILAAVLAEAPDIVVFAEAAPMRPMIPELAAEFAFVSPCPAEACELLVASRTPPERFWRLPLNPIWPARYAVLEFAPDQFLSVVHLTKPWFSGVTEAELAQLIAQYNWLPETALAVGDFNMPPWGGSMQRLLSETGFATARRSPGTWPVGAGRAGLPIDQVLVRGAVEIVSITPFGADLGSNHRGLVAEIAWP